MADLYLFASPLPAARLNCWLASSVRVGRGWTSIVTFPLGLAVSDRDLVAELVRVRDRLVVDAVLVRDAVAVDRGTRRDPSSAS